MASKSVGMFQRPVEYKARKPYAVQADFASGIDVIKITSYFGVFNENSDRNVSISVDTVIDSGYEYNFLFDISIYSNNIDLDKRFSNTVNALYLLKKEISEGVFYGGTYEGADNYVQAFKSIYPPIIDQVIASVMGNKELIKNSYSWELSLL